MMNGKAALRTALIKISFHRSKGLFKKCVGKKRGADGRLRARIFWLGPIQQVAIERAKIYLNVWQEVVESGEEGWTPEFEAQADKLIKGTERWAKLVAEAASSRIGQTIDTADQLRRMVAPTIRPVTDEPEVAKVLPDAPPAPPVVKPSDKAPAVVTLYAAIDAYDAAMQSKALSRDYRKRITETMGDLKHWRKDEPLAGIDRVWLEQLTDFIKARPKGRRKSKATGRYEPLKPFTVKTLLQHWRQFFDWLDRASDSDRFGGWEAPKRMNELFAVDLNKIRTKQERDQAADGPSHLTVDEIKKLVHAGNERQRMLMLLALFAGMGQSELSCTRREEFDLDAGTFCHRRGKTGQRGQWYLPPELVAMLREYFNKVKPIAGGLAFSTREGQPLVTAASDSVRQWFDDVRAAAGITRAGVSFYAFRRYLGDRAKRFGGTDLRDAALAHAPKSVGDRHYSNHRDFGKVEELGRQLSAELKAAEIFALRGNGHGA